MLGNVQLNSSLLDGNVAGERGGGATLEGVIAALLDGSRVTNNRATTGVVSAMPHAWSSSATQRVCSLARAPCHHVHAALLYGSRETHLWATTGVVSSSSAASWST